MTPQSKHSNTTSCLNTTADQLSLLQVIDTLTQQEMKILTLPAVWRGSSDTLLQGATDTQVQGAPVNDLPINGPKLLAGRLFGQTSPDIGFMLWDGRFEEVFRFAQRLYEIGGHINFKLALIDELRNGNRLQWGWLKGNTKM